MQDENLGFGVDEVREWEYFAHPFLWQGYEVIADRHLPNGVRQHKVKGYVPENTFVRNAHIVGE